MNLGKLSALLGGRLSSLIGPQALIGVAALFLLSAGWAKIQGIRLESATAKADQVAYEQQITLRLNQQLNTAINLLESYQAARTVREQVADRATRSIDRDQSIGLDNPLPESVVRVLRGEPATTDAATDDPAVGTTTTAP